MIVLLPGGCRGVPTYLNGIELPAPFVLVLSVIYLPAEFIAMS